MSLGKGWIKLFRQSEDNQLYFSEPFDRWHAWQDLLLIVNHEKRQLISKGHLITLEPGQTVTSDRILAQRWRWSREKVRRFLKLLSDTSMCGVKRTTNGTILTIVNWEKFQGQQPSDETTDETTDETLTRRKEYKEEKNIFGKATHTTPPTLEEVREYCEKRNNDIDPEQFFEYYKMRDWKLSRGQQMTDWKASVRYWERNRKQKAAERHPDNDPAQKSEYWDVFDDLGVNK